MEDEPARRLAPAGNRVGARALGFEFSVLCHLPPVHTGRESSSLESEPAGRSAPFRKRLGVKRRGSCPPLSSMEGAPPARQRALNTRAGLTAWRIDTSNFLASGTTQLVEGAALIQR